MPRLITFSGLWLLAMAGTLSLAQLSSTGAGKKASPAAAYSGPGDVVASAAAWYGLRAYSTADRGNRLMNVCNVADVACADLSSDATTGALVISTIGGSSCSIVTCTIKTMYDRSGNSYDVTQATIAQRPSLIASCVNSLPCARFNAANPFLTNTGTASFNQVLTISTVDARKGATSTVTVVFAMGGQVVFHVGANTLGLFSAGTTTVTANDSVWHATQGVFNGASSVINVDGTGTTVNPGSGGGTTIVQIGDAVRTINFDFTEGGMWASSFSAGNRTSMCQNQQAYWGSGNFGAVC